jgi:hypothetical protein
MPDARRDGSASLVTSDIPPGGVPSRSSAFLRTRRSFSNSILTSAAGAGSQRTSATSYGSAPDGSPSS